MDFTKTPPFDCEVRSKFLTAENKFGAKIHKRLCVVYSEEHVMNVQKVQWWQLFKEGRASMHDGEREHRPHSEINEML